MPIAEAPNGIWYPAMVANCIIQITKTRYDNDYFIGRPGHNRTVEELFKNVLLEVLSFLFWFTILSACVQAYCLLICSSGIVPVLDLNGGNLGIVGRTEVSSVCPCPLIEFNYYP